jgi:hypothetical protein
VHTKRAPGTHLIFITYDPGVGKAERSVSRRVGVGHPCQCLLSTAQFTGGSGAPSQYRHGMGQSDRRHRERSDGANREGRAGIHGRRLCHRFVTCAGSDQVPQLSVCVHFTWSIPPAHRHLRVQHPHHRTTTLTNSGGTCSGSNCVVRPPCLGTRWYSLTPAARPGLFSGPIPQ